MKFVAVFTAPNCSPLVKGFIANDKADIAEWGSIIGWSLLKTVQVSDFDDSELIVQDLRCHTRTFVMKHPTAGDVIVKVSASTWKVMKPFTHVTIMEGQHVQSTMSELEKFIFEKLS